MKVALRVFTIAALLVQIWPTMAHARQSPAKATQARGLTIDLVVKLVQAGVPQERVVDLIQQTPGYFDLSLEIIDSLRIAGIPTVVLNAMLKAGRNGQSLPPAPPVPQPGPIALQPSPNAQNPPPPDIHPGPGPTGPGGAGGGGGVGGSTGGNTGPTLSGPAERSPQVKAARIPPDPWKPPDNAKDPGCPTLKQGKSRRVDLDYDTGSSSASRLCDTGLYCFALRNANPLYDWAITVNVTEPTGNPFDLLNDSITALKSLATGAAAATTTAAAKPPTPNPLGVCLIDLSDVTAKATNLGQLLSALAPGKDSSGKVIYVPLAATRKNWQPVPDAFNAFEQAVQKLQTAYLNSAGCDASLLRQAEAIILDDYPKVRAQYQSLATKLSNPTVVYYERALDATDTADLVATPSYAGVASNAKTFHFNPCFGIVSGSAGFLLTRLPARAYASATSPDPNDPTKTQNVLRVDYGAGIRPALAALLTANIPQVNFRNYGLGVTAGPVFDISNGKADTSRFGFFGGLSLRLTPWVYLTPGIHFSEFADFPQGFTHPGQLIPANTGTPTPVKRFTGRFAFAVTFKIKDLGAPTGGAQTKTQQGGSSSP